MKKQYLVFFVFLSAILCSCGDEPDSRVTLDDRAPGKVTNVTTESGPGEVYITWTNPDSESFMYSKVEYVNSKGEKKYQLFSKEKGENGVMTTTVSGFASTDPVKFSIFSCSVNGNNSGAVEVEASPSTPAFAVVAETLDVEPDFGGVRVSWKNESVAPVYVVVNYQAKGDAGKSGSAKFRVEAKTTGSYFVQLALGGGDYLSGEACIINAATQDIEENTSDFYAFESTPKNITKLSKAGWSFPEYQDSNDATISYSSQEAGGEGASPNGRVLALIDDNKSTFWHTAWKTSSAYPHFFIIDMGEDTEVSNFEITRRLGNDGTHKGQTFYTCTDAAAADKTNPDSWSWVEQGKFSFDPSTDTPQMYRFDTPQKVRYIKVYFAQGDKGSSNFVMISEVNVFSPEN